MLRLCRKAAPDLFAGAGPSCVQMGYCPENKRQHSRCVGRVLTKEQAMEMLRAHGGQQASAEDFTDQ